MAFASGADQQRQKLVSEIIADIDDCMELLKAQLNKNPNTRLYNNSNKKKHNNNSNHHHHHNNNNKRRYDQQFDKSDQEQKSADSYHSNPKKKKNRRKRNKKQIDPNVYMSKRLSFYLRHGAEKAGLKIRNDGYVKVTEILKMNEFKDRNATFDDLKRIVDTNDKKRFKMINEDKIWFIRANQGHSIKSVDSEQLLNEITMNDIDKYPIVCHGTFLKAWDIIKNQGLKTMSRNHIHFVPSDCVDGKGVISGMRYNCQILIYIDLNAAIKDGIKFFLSSNNVLLSSGIDGNIPPKYFQKVTTFEKGKAGKVIWSPDMEDGDNEDDDI